MKSFSPRDSRTITHRTAKTADKKSASKPTNSTQRASSTFKKQHHPRSRSHAFKESYTFEQADARIYDVFRHHGFGDFPHEQRRQLTAFYMCLVEIQKKENFTRLLTLRDVALKHFVDCLMVAKLTQLSFPLLDIGSGAGFPGIPLKILYPDSRIILAEPVKKRVDFLKSVREELNLKELDILGRKIDASFELPVAGVISRAVEKVDEGIQQVLGCLQVGGHLVFMKGPNVDPELKSALQKWKSKFKLVEDHPYHLPNSPHARRLVVLKRWAW